MARRFSPRFGPLPDIDVLLAPSFVAVDFETANRLGGASACQVALARFADGELQEVYSSLIRPPATHGEFEFTYIHGITAQMVASAPTWDQIVPEVLDFAGGRPVYAHNSPFDRKVWADLDAYYGDQTVPEQVFCTVSMARAALPSLPNHKLPTVVQALCPDFDLNHHEASSDAVACGLIVAALAQRVREFQE